MIRIGILGAAKIAPKAVLQPASARTDCEVVAVAARDADRAQAYADEHGIAHVADSYEALLARDDIDLIYNALPPHRHADLTIASLEAGKAVLCEKPFAMNAGEAVRMVEASNRTGKPLIEAFHYRFHPAFQRVLDIVCGGELGTVRRIEAAFDVTIPYRPGELRHTLAVGGGALMDLGCYPLHAVRALIGAEPTVVSATAHCDHPGVDLRTVAEFAFPGGETASIHTSMAPDTPFDAWIRVEGSDGRLEIINPIHPHRGHSITATIKGNTETFTVDGQSTYDHQLAHVVDVLEGGAVPLTGGADAIGNMAAIDAIYRAAGLRPRGL
ncbi:Gfo/Idh/MocA family protein [Hyphomonas oceanitis]|uniref:NAD-binding oxidoreductase n=1 Tax=Hyphomonas oceanitis SCH89 TaxID=1280953 RepID=A0A059GBG3_9PROT|nr:Gfo/Idh/MocA family oxidoreductase [Hyphomonas oceanitis]KDA04192.1 NAD-binding oxidoreductase [Hyphomonas oceanitis SCH89]